MTLYKKHLRAMRALITPTSDFARVHVGSMRDALKDLPVRFGSLQERAGGTYLVYTGLARDVVDAYNFGVGEGLLSS